MVLEPLNLKQNHPGVYLHGSPQAYALCKAVNRPSCKILFDMYHQQITEGNLLPNIDQCWDEIAYLQSGDNPGRKEPGTGEINYKNVFQHIADKDYRGIIGMEHGNSQRGEAGERAVIAAYRAVDPASSTQSPGR
jgi:hydroxypyruvate isomerase